MSYRTEVLADSPLLYWEMQETNTASTVVLDSSGFSRAGTRVSTTIAQGPAAHSQVYSYFFDGIDDRCYLTNQTLFNVADFAFEIVANLLALPAAGKRAPIITVSQGLDSSTRDKAIYLRGDGYLEIYGFDGATKRGSPSGLVTLGMHHLVGKHSAGKLDLWVDGVKEVSIDCGPTFTGYSAATLIVGGQNMSSDPLPEVYANMRASDVAWYSALPDSRIPIHSKKALAPNSLGGTATLDNGQAASYVLIRNWVDNQHIAKVVPNTDGTWTYNVGPGQYEVTTVGPDGYQPICHGPVIAVENP